LARRLCERRIVPFFDLHAAEPADDVDPPVLTSKLAVGNDAQARFFLRSDRVADRGVFDRPQVRRIDLPASVPIPGRVKLVRAQEAADVIRAEKRLRAGHTLAMTSDPGTTRSVNL
jgi:hypothetical protein